MRETLFVLGVLLCSISFPHAALFWVASKWWEKNAALVYDDYDRYIMRMAFPPWYVRYSMWVLRRPYPPPSEWVLNRPK